MDDKIKMTDDVRSIIKTIEEHGHEAFIVGGCVRDNCMGKPVHDWDITTSARPEEIKAYFANTYDTGIKHGTVTVRLGKRSYEVTTYRIDGEYLDGRHPESVGFTKDIRLDLQRRDFTMNAIAYNEAVGYVDPFDGMKDIQAGIIRAVGNPAERFDEDALRMFRALRFSAQLRFEIEPETYRTIVLKQEQIKHVSVERIREELTRLLLSGRPYLDKLVECGLLRYLLIGVYLDKNNGKLGYITDCLSRTPAHPAERYAILLSFADPAHVAEIMTDLKFDNLTISEASRLAAYLHKPLEDDFYSIRKFASESVPLFERVIELKKAVAYTEHDIGEMLKLDCITDKYELIKERRDPLVLKDLQINGSDIIKLGIFGERSTPMIGNLLRELLEAVLRTPEINKKELLTELALNYTKG